MKSAWYTLGVALGAVTGCVTMPAVWEKPDPPPPAVARPARPQPPVTPEQVTDENAHEKAEALLRELDREAHQSMLPARTKSAGE